MIAGIGIDSIEIARFKNWHQKSFSSLLRIFHPSELDYIFQNTVKIEERFAARFAAKEAFFKAASSAHIISVPFLSICPFVFVANSKTGYPSLVINTEQIRLSKPVTIHLSLTHSKTVATASVIIEE